MAMLDTLQALAARKRSALTQSPFGEFAVLGLLLWGIHIGLNHTQNDTDLLQAATNASAVTRFNTVVDLINPNERLANDPDLAQKHQTSTARFSFSKTTDNNQRFYFKPILDNEIMLHARDLFSDIDSDNQSKVAIWNIDKNLSFGASKSTIYIPTHKRKKNDKFIVMIDPGHGGTDPGSVSHNGLEEKALTLDIAKRAAKFLSEVDDIEILLTRNNDSGMSRQSRVNKIRRSNADMIVSLHFNHLPQKEINLVETFYASPKNILESIRLQREKNSKHGLVKASANHTPDLSFTKGSRSLAKAMQSRVFQEVQRYNPITSNAGIKEDMLFILTRSFTPGVLIELSCLSNVREAKLLADPRYRDKLAASLADGIRDYIYSNKAKSQQEPGV